MNVGSRSHLNNQRIPTHDLRTHSVMLHSTFAHHGPVQPDDFVHMKKFTNLHSKHHQLSHSMSDEEAESIAAASEEDVKSLDA